MAEVIRKSVLIPLENLSPPSAEAIRESATRKGLAEAQAIMPDARLMIRDLFPTDLELTNEVWLEVTGGTANQWEDTSISDKKIDDDRVVIIWGVVDNSEVAGAVSGLKFKVGGATVHQWNLDKLIKLENRAALSLDPVIIPQGISITVQRYVKFTNQGVEIILDGCVIEKEGKVLKE